jgi:hypothetical protein
MIILYQKFMLTKIDFFTLEERNKQKMLKLGPKLENFQKNKIRCKMLYHYFYLVSCKMH